MTRAVLLAALVATLACKREERRLTDVAALSRTPEPAAQATNRPGGVTPGKPPPSAPNTARGHEDLGDAWSVSQGYQLYVSFNCAGCHSNGGGGMGPPLMESGWRYGSAPEQIYESIVKGRPNGMPAFGGRIPEAQIWQLVAYVRSLSGNVPYDVRPSRSDSMSVKTAPSLEGRSPPKPEGSK